MLKIMAIGNLTGDVELKKNAEGQPYAMLRIASDRRYKDKSGNKLTDFISAKVRGPLAERCAAWGYKGAKVAGCGRAGKAAGLYDQGQRGAVFIRTKAGKCN